MKYYEQIEDYIKGALSDQERVAFEQEMANDDELRTTVDQFPVIAEALEAGAQDDARSLVKRVRAELTGETTSSIVIGMRRWRVAAGICILVALGGGLFYSNAQYTSTALVRNAYEAPADLGITKSAEDPESHWSVIKAAWQKGDKVGALKVADDFLSEHPEDLDLRGRVAYLNFLWGDYEKSLSLLRGMRDDRQFGDYADFHTALILYRTGEKDSGLELMNEIATDPANRFSDEAKEFQQKSGSFWHRIAFQ